MGFVSRVDHFDAPSVFRSEGARGGRLAISSHAPGWDFSLLHADSDGKCRHLLFLPSQATALLSRKEGSLVKHAKVLEVEAWKGAAVTHSFQDSGPTLSHDFNNTPKLNKFLRNKTHLFVKVFKFY